MQKIFKKYEENANSLEELSEEVLKLILKEVEKKEIFNKYKPELRIMDFLDNERYSIMFNIKHSETQKYYLYIFGNYVVFGKENDLINSNIYRLNVTNVLTNLDCFLKDCLLENLKNLEMGGKK